VGFSSLVGGKYETPAMILRRWSCVEVQEEAGITSLGYQTGSTVAGVYSVAPGSRKVHCTSDMRACRAVAEATVAPECGDADDLTSHCLYSWL
jgi:hypothetical protein